MTLLEIPTAHADEARTDRPFVVLGGGPAGLTAGYLLAKAGRPVIVLEADDQVGGIAKTVVDPDGYRFDLGGHRFFTKNQEVNDLWLEIMGDEFLLRPRMSRIFWRGRYLDYPLKGTDVIRKLGPVELVRCTLSYAWAAIKPKGREDDLETWVSNRFGKRLYRHFFKSYTEKVWGVPATEIRSEWAAQRIKGLSFYSAAKAAFLGNRNDKIKTAPKAWKDLWTVPEYKGKIGIYNIVNSAGQMFIALTSKIWTGGDKDIDTAYKKIAELKPFKQTDFSGDMEKLLIQGEVQVGILDMPAAIRLKRGGAPIGWVAPSEGMIMFEQDTSVTAGSKNKPTAFAFVNYMLQKETQESWLRNQFYLPANTQVKIPDDLKPVIPVTMADISKILQWDWLWISDQKAKLIDRWNKEMSS